MPTLKGAFINLGAGLLGALPNIITFQFNPETISRTPSIPLPLSPSDGSGRVDGTQQPDDPGETMSFSLRLDATDQLVLEDNPVAATRGIYPTLSALELLMVPKSSLSIDLFKLSGGPAPSQLPPNKLSTILFIWGSFRILPVIITSLSINETEFDTLLNPVRAEITVSLQVLTLSQITSSPFASGAYRYTQGVKEVMAALNLVNAAEIGVSNSLSFLL
jgi:hypothetical protein